MEREGRTDFLREYLLQTRKEIDVEKIEGTRLLHLKILLMGAVLALAKGITGLWAIVVLPLAVIAIDMMQASRLLYILHRWEYLARHIVPRIREDLGDPDLPFFEEGVVQRNDGGLYKNLEGRVRTLIFVPAAIASSLALGILLHCTANCPEALQLTIMIAWLIFLCVVGCLLVDVYQRCALIIAFSLVTIFLIIDGFVPSFSVVSLLEVTERLKPTP
jgi:hypothetical protein